ncbi:Hypothetical protein Mbur_1164 [Methanococcoides burtonii DSM 6242]|uniref:Tyr recombinase domain-containing protein n=1 Tax=Methanococcoides burtonii (strain DSM 6242 / NBRC 107633 / OCM 468 / ACE-M) TaxID=259564 RepID=Q12WT9_METBU|nr:Hypothetical protein Mbur_1164 [Methanococcoides burtonii DSM 6242]
MLPPGWKYIHTGAIQIVMCVNKGNIKKGQHMQYMGCLMILRRLAKSPGINKRIHPHLFRHSRASSGGYGSRI